MAPGLYQKCLFDQPNKVEIAVSEDHELVRLSKEMNWSDLILQAMEIEEAE